MINRKYNGFLDVEILNLKFPNPLILAAGILGLTAPLLKRVVYSGAGGVVTKSIGLKSREGYPNPTIVDLGYGLVNSMGLPNPGLKMFIEELEELKGLKVPLILSIYAFSEEELMTMGKIISKLKAVSAVELNVSCPHVGGISEIGKSPELVKSYVKTLKDNLSNKPIIVKLTPNVSDITSIAMAAVNGGADALTAINTVKSMVIDIETGKPLLAGVFGGLSGPAIKPIALRCVYEITETLDVPVFGCGGVETARDVIEFIMAGAVAVQIGSAIARRGLRVFREISIELKRFLELKGFKSLEEVRGLAHRR
ncbi:dihydroorotate dehydrogenase [Candidatus Bathyarchaeota archaeon]|nr:dihydroorotate dehydrogenase [Candidatus Bathyarchaeota archaeon]MBS7612861.1 dihydroorotate dehydrogenase [Candidatus Bathyarchaeota archaeon]MBS7617553.1 dihydroorotate dehydrogenase [Candidatus Bathyarchaeota archaeon]